LAGANEVVKLDLSDESTFAGALDNVNAVYSASLDPLIKGHLNFSNYMGGVDSIDHVVRVC
jgi:hypothetical protein